MMSHHPRKRFGQNFLRDPHVLDRILAAADLAPDERVLEIGPGRGALTDRLLAAGVEVLAVEIDRDLAAELKSRREDNLEMVVADVLARDWRELLTRPPYKLVANLPYNISSQVLFKVLDHRQCFSRLVLMFQQEVGQRLIADPGAKDYGILSVLVQTWFEVAKVVKVPPRAFYPPPKVDSVVLKMTPLAQPRAEIDDEAMYRRLVRGAFGQRRKTLRNSLLGTGFEADTLDPALAAAGIDPRRRGETLTIEEFARLANQVGRSLRGE